MLDGPGVPVGERICVRIVARPRDLRALEDDVNCAFVRMLPKGVFRGVQLLDQHLRPEEILARLTHRLGEEQKPCIRERKPPATPCALDRTSGDRRVLTCSTLTGSTQRPRGSSCQPFARISSMSRHRTAILHRRVMPEPFLEGVRVDAYAVAVEEID